jgi:hypothetical protein
MNDDLLLETFEPLDGTRPYNVLDRHPDGRSIALQAYLASAHGERAAVWDLDSGTLIWKPSDTIALCWLLEGDHALLLRETYRRDPQHPPIIASPLQSEFTYTLERQTWPEHQLIRSCIVTPPEGWVNRVTVSPRKDLASVRWFEQHAAGFVLIDLDPDEDRQLPGVGYRTAPYNLVEGPVFSPDGRFIVLTCGRGFWWSDEAGDPMQPAAGGSYELGHVAIYYLANHSVREIHVREEVPAGWLPDDPEDIRNELLGEPVFADDQEFTVLLPNGSERRFSTE